MLAFMAEHRLVLERQVHALLGGSSDSVRRRLRTLAAKGYVSRWRGFDAAWCCAIRRRGLAAIGSVLNPPEENPGMYRHDVGAVELWLAAHRGAFGPLAEVIGERRIRSHDMVAPEDPYSIRLGGYHGDGRERRHYPDLVLVDRHGRRLALELELSPKEKARREEILAGYGADRRVVGVLYLFEDSRQGRAIGRALETTAAEMGVTDRVHVRCLMTLAQGPGGQGVSQRGRGLKPVAAEAVL
jgi:hypothetical protein